MGTECGPDPPNWPPGHLPAGGLLCWGLVAVGWQGCHLPQRHWEVINQQHSVKSLGQARAGSDSGRNGVLGPQGHPRSNKNITQAEEERGAVRGPGAIMKALGEGLEGGPGPGVGQPWV